MSTVRYSFLGSAGLVADDVVHLLLQRNSEAVLALYCVHVWRALPHN